jgi:ABC-type Fe3+ transport system permease subunit
MEVVMKKWKYWWPLVAFMVPTVVIGYGFVIPGSCIDGWTHQNVGFVGTLVGVAATYYLGIKAVVTDLAAKPEA